MGWTEVDADDVRDAIRQWEPGELKTEEAYEKSLYGFLNEKFPDATFHRQYSHAKTRADLFVDFEEGADVVVEVKRALHKRDEFHRLVGQVFEYLMLWEAEVVVVLCGSTDPALKKLVRKAVEVLGEATGKKVHVLYA